MLSCIYRSPGACVQVFIDKIIGLCDIICNNKMLFFSGDSMMIYSIIKDTHKLKNLIT